MALNQSTDASLDLDNIRRTLVRLEETIIFCTPSLCPSPALARSCPGPALIERAQFVRNPRIYQEGAFEQLSAKDSFLGWLLRQTEETHGQSASSTTTDPR